VAADLLVSLQGGEKLPVFETPVKLVVRESTGPAPG
jgi:hypothetical protein